MITMTGSPDTDHLRLDTVITERWNFTMGRFWLTDEQGNTVAMVNGELCDDGETFELWDIEVRKPWRGQQLGRRALEAVGRATNRRVEHSGGYTPEGLRSIAPIFHDKEGLNRERDQLFRSMTFVASWLDRTVTHE